jgi:hypothetical protein
MKSSNKLFLLLLLIFPALFSCERDMESEGISKTVTLPPAPEITLSGTKVMSLQIGETFTDPGATASEGGTVSSVTRFTPFITQGQADPSLYSYGYKKRSVNSDVPGMYRITYTATNPGGSSEETRYVFVLTKPVDATKDLTGTYSSGTSPQAKISRVAPGVYFSTNAWGGGSTVVIPAYLVSPDGVEVNVPYQDTDDNHVTPIYGYGTRLANGNLELKMTRPTFATPLFDQNKVFVKLP